jgi:hypothetical protein
MTRTKWLLAGVASFMLGGLAQAQSAPAGPIDTTPPMIGGVLPGFAVVGQAFSFQPSASDTGPGALAFAIVNQPTWASFDPVTGRLAGTPSASDVGTSSVVTISVTDGTFTRSLPSASLSVVASAANGPLKANYGHYFATRYSDSPADAAMLCEQPGVSGVVWRQTWQEVEPNPGAYDFGSFDKALAAIAASHHPQCQLFLMVEFKSFANSPVKNPCPSYLQAQHSGPNSGGNGSATCFMWEPEVVDAYGAMLRAAAARFDANPRVEGVVFQESALGFNGQYSQDVSDGGTYSAQAWRDALISIINQCAAAFTSSRCVAFLNFLNGGQGYLHDISAAISAIPNNQACFSGPDVLPNSPALYRDATRAYPVLAQHVGCRSNSIQNDSFEVPGCGLDCVFHFAVSGTFGDFPKAAPLSGGLCINSYLFWNHRTIRSATGLDWTDALPVIAANPYGSGWYSQCAGGSAPP